MADVPSGRTLETDFMFTKLLVQDIERSAAFYTTVFGLVEMNRLEARIIDRPVEEVVYMATYAGGPMLILARFGDTHERGSDEVILGFATRDLEAALERTIQAGGKILEPIQEPYPGMRHAFIADEEGHVVQISQMAA